MVAATLSFGRLALANRFEHCHDPACQPDGLTSDFLDIVSIGNVASFSSVTAAIVYLLEATKRKEREHHELFERLLVQRQASASNSLGRLRTLENLSAAGLWQDDFDLVRADFSHSDLTGADLRGANDAGANAPGAELNQMRFDGRLQGQGGSDVANG
ncbi:pentapeptide repeat-containing protein [Synechococcus sp. CS-1332]|uniref:pentapeptide repeat-containing protein n=1 Tax=Synechococcus sp. CS-1332 TaxID=2847972 RepID=UPI00223AF0E4|nr:pentapeptide repeat-containing protein [Synechococcus sp. CS-1332]MCT0207711.1 pentapeptide repeat-containing protein [Synechococcus sp. CS-1332]